MLLEVKYAVFGASKCTRSEFSAKIRLALMYGRPCFFCVIPTYEPLPWFMICQQHGGHLGGSQSRWYYSVNFVSASVFVNEDYLRPKDLV